ncbi:MAG: malonic semialdehyde reductase, partial [Sandarakinorhabdus sp.]|nr:malonic semialdehyde reductase [Sandarakinorhabdus sp.]
MSGTPLDDGALDLLFREARTYYSWADTPVSDADLHALYDLVKMGPTSANASPARFIFASSPAAKAKLAATASEANAPKILAAPVTVIIGFDNAFYDKLPELFPHADARSWFAGNAELARETAFRNSALQGAYLILAARALGWDTGPMS